MTENKQLKNVIFWLQSQGYISSQKDLAKKLGYNEAFVSQMVIGKKAVSGNFIEKIILFSEGKVNADYLNGMDVPMLISDVEQVEPSNMSQIPAANQKYIEALESLLTYKDKEIAELKALKAELENKIARLQRTTDNQEA